MMVSSAVLARRPSQGSERAGRDAETGSHRLPGRKREDLPAPARHKIEEAGRTAERIVKDAVVRLGAPKPVTH